MKIPVAIVCIFLGAMLGLEGWNLNATVGLKADVSALKSDVSSIKSALPGQSHRNDNPAAAFYSPRQKPMDNQP